MGRFVGAVPDNDRERLARILDEKTRMFGVDKKALDRQTEERRAREAQKAGELRAFAQKAAQLDGVLCAAQHASEQQRRAINQDVDSYRRRQALDKSQRQARERCEELAASQAEQQGVLSSPWHNEDPRLERSALSPHRVRRDHWKGMSEEELGRVRETQAQQVAAKAQRQQQELREKQAYESRQQGFLSTMARQAVEADAARKAEAGQLAAELQRQAQEKRERDDALNRLYSTNQPTAGYHAQFGTSHR